MTGLGYKFIYIDYGQLSITVVHQYINFWYTSFYIFQIYYADSLWKYSFVFLITSLHKNTHTNALRGKCPNTDHKELRIYTFFTQWRTHPAFLWLILLDSTFVTNLNFFFPVNLKFRIYIFSLHIIVLPQHIRWHQLVIPDNLFYKKNPENQQETFARKISWTRHFTTVGQPYCPFWYFLTRANQKAKMPKS